MLQYTTPAQAGISEKAIKGFMKEMIRDQINLHSVLMMRGDQVFFEKYWTPFQPDQPHRMYSVTKSFVSVAIGFLIQEGKLSLEDKIVDFFPDKVGDTVDPWLAMQTIENMLTMRTCFYSGNWFQPSVKDRLEFYFQRPADKVPGTVWTYDSNGSYVLGCLVERLSGMKLLDYLKEKVLDRIGGFENAHILSTMDGTPWADSAMICSTRALAAFARFVMNEGSWEGEQLLNADYVRAAVSFQSDNDLQDHENYNTYGYGYQFWRTEQDSYSMNGMGAQFAICVPAKDLIFCCTADDQLSSVTDSPRIYRAFFDFIVKDTKDDSEDDFDLNQELYLSVARGKAASGFASTIQDRTFICRPNPMGWKWFRFHFSPQEVQDCCLTYENEQGVKELFFGMKKNCFTKFPQFGYSDEYGNQHDLIDFLYQAAVSAGWVEERKLQLRVQVIDRYFGLLVMTFGFTPQGLVTCSMMKSAEDFFGEYDGWLNGEMQIEKES